MRWRAFLLVSLAANLVLAVGWMLSARQHRRIVDRATLAAANLAAAPARTNILVRKQFFSWEEVESDDYAKYIANLRDIGCPSQTIRDIIIADINSLYARRAATEIVTPEQQWWLPDADASVQQAAVQRLRELNSERRDLLAKLLGADWESGDLVNLPRPTRTGVTLDGPVLGVLPNDIKQAVQEISLRSQDQLQAYTEAQRAAGKTPDAAELERMRRQIRNELAKVLSPQQLEEFLLRYSQNASALRSELGQLQHFAASPDEFRAIFRATDSFEQQLQMLANASDPTELNHRRALEQQRDNALRLALGAERYELFRRLHEADYRDAYAAAVGAGSPDRADAILEINRAAAEELERIRALTNLTAQQRSVELKKAELEQLKATAQALGHEIPTETPKTLPTLSVRKQHVLAPGESVNVLTRLYGINPDALRAANPDLNFDRLKAGDSVNIPLHLLPLPPPPPQ